MLYHSPTDPTRFRLPSQGRRTGRVVSALWLVAALGLAAVTGANAILIKQASARDRQLRSYRTGQLRQVDGVEEVIPRQFEPVHDELSDLILVRDADERGTPHRAAPLTADEILTVSFARTDGTLVLIAEPPLPAARPYTPHRGRAPPPASL